MSVPPPPSAAPPSLGGLPATGPREHVIALEASRSWGRRRGDVESAIRLTPGGAVVTYGRLLQGPLAIPLGTLQMGLIDPGPAHPSGQVGRFPILKRLSPTAVIPREQGIEGWLWTSAGGSGLTLLCDDGHAPNAALLFTKPLGEEAIDAFVPSAAAEIRERSPLGAPAVLGLLLRVADPLLAERTFTQYQLLRPLTDREVPPPMRRALPTDVPADPVLYASEDARAATSVAPPGMG
jgi:hypothetical protein